MKKLICVISVICLISGSDISTAQSWVEVQKIVASDRLADDNFGFSVSIDSNYAIVGAFLEDHDTIGGDSMSTAGSAYVFERDGAGNWIQVQKIVASDRAVDDKFGISVSISGNYAIVGARWEDEDPTGGNFMSAAGSAYVFERDGSGNWNEVQKIVASDRAVDDFFGISVSISGNYAIVGAVFEDLAGNDNAGSAYVFERDGGGTWNQVQKIVASDRAGGDWFGISVSISGSYAIVGAWLEDEDATGGNTMTSASSAYVFERDGAGNWIQVQKIVASDRAALDQFGISVSISGDYAIVGAYDEDEDAAGGNTFDKAGSAYVFERDGSGNWNQVQKIVASDRAGDDWFGISVSISGNYAIVGAWFEDQDATGGNTSDSAGSAYVFERDGGGTWNEVQKIVASDRAGDDWFGNSVSISGNYAIIGAYFEDEDATGGNTMSKSGSAYVFEVLFLTPVFLADTLCLGDSTAFTDQTTGSPTSWLWNFDDPASGAANTSTLPNPKHLFTAAGSYDVKLVASNGSDTDSITQTVIVKPTYTTPATATICDNDSIILGGSYQNTPGTYYDTLVSVDGCDSVIATTLTVNPTYTTPAIATICDNDSILLGGSYQNTPGTYYDTLVSVSGCDSVIATTLTVNPTYTTPAADTICDNDSIILGGSYQNTPGTYYDTLVASSGCDSVIATTLTVNPTYTTPAADTICDNDSIILGGSYQNTPGTYYDTLASVSGCDSVIVTTLIVNPVYVVNLNTGICQGDSIFLGGNWQDTSGIYYDTLSSSSGCDSIIITDLTVIDSIVAVSGPDTSICQGDSAQLNASGGINYSWSPPMGLNDTSIANPTATPITTTIYQVIVSGCGNPDTTYVTIIVTPYPIVNLGKDTTICLGDSMTLDAGNPGATYNWSTGETTQTITVYGTIYSVEVNNGLCIGLDTININVKDPDSCAGTKNTFFIPNSFSPNGDGNNDVLWIKGQSIKTIHLSIYNRWGEKVFETYAINQGWDGTYKGKKLNTAVFGWYAEVEFEDDSKIYRKGNVTLIR